MVLQKKCCLIVSSMYLGMYAVVESLKDLIFRIFKDFSILHIRFSRIGRDKFGLFFTRPRLFSAAAAAFFSSFVFEKLQRKRK